MKRHHWLLVGAAAILVAGWLLWNVLLVEEDLGARGEGGGGTRHLFLGSDRGPERRDRGGLSLTLRRPRWVPVAQIHFATNAVRFGDGFGQRRGASGHGPGPSSVALVGGAGPSPA